MRRKSTFLVVLWLAVVTVVYCPETDTRNRNVQECGLSDREIDEVFDSVEATWTVDDGFLASHQLQDVLDCANTNEAVVLKISQRLKLESVLTISKQITIRAYKPPTGTAKVMLTCPPDDTLMLIENAAVVLEDIVIQDCFFPKDLAVQSLMRVKCDKEGDKAFDINLLNVEFLTNYNAGGSTGIYVENPECISITMTNVTFRNNTFLLGSMLAHNNNLSNVEVIGNTQASKRKMNAKIESITETADIPTAILHNFDADRTRANEAKEALLQDAFIHLPKKSNSTLIEFSANVNDGVVIFVDEGNVDIGEGSIFKGNKRNKESTIIAVASSVSLKGVLFKSNGYAEYGSCLTLSDGSSAIIDSTIFSNNGAAWGSCISARGIKSLEISRSAFERNYATNYAALSVDGAFDSSASLMISQTNFTRNLGGCGYLCFTPFAVVPRECLLGAGTLLISNFDSGSVLVMNSSFDDNKAMSIHCFGTGRNFHMSNSQKVHLKIDGVAFNGNTWHYGAGLCFEGVSGNFSIKNSSFHRNSVTSSGSAIYFKSGTIPRRDTTRVKLVDCSFYRNEGFSATVYVEGRLNEFSMSRVRFDSNVAYKAPSVLSLSNAYSFSMIDSRVSENHIRGRSSNAARGTLYIDRVKNVILRRSNFSRNSAGKARGHVGGAMYFLNKRVEYCTLIAERCIFEANEAADGGAIFMEYYDISVSIRNCFFHSNTASGYGGAITILKTGLSLILINTRFINNTATVGGAMRMVDGWRLVIYGCMFANNTASHAGGAIVYKVTEIRSRVLNITSTSFIKNRAEYGGAVLLDQIPPEYAPNEGQVSFNDVASKAVIQRNNPRLLFVGNTAKIAGGAIFVRDLKLAKGWLGSCGNASDKAMIGEDSPVSKLRNFSCPNMHGNAVDEPSGYGPDIATPSVGFFLKFTNEKGDKISFPQGSTHMMGPWKSGDPLPTMQILAYDMYGQGPARTRSELGRVLWLKDFMVLFPSYETVIVALLHSPDGLLETDLSSDMTHGKGKIVLGSPRVVAGDYSLILRVPKVSNKSITLNVTAHKGLINEFLRGDKSNVSSARPATAAFTE